MSVDLVHLLGGGYVSTSVAHGGRHVRMSAEARIGSQSASLALGMTPAEARHLAHRLRETADQVERQSGTPS